MPDEVDADLLERFVRGDCDAFERLFRRYQLEVHFWILRVLRNASAADEALVEAFWRAYRGRAGFDPSRSFGAWMRRIATNVALDHLRASRPLARWLVADDRMPAPADPDRGLADALALAFERLPPRLRIVATLALIEEQPYTQIAEALDLPVGTIKSRVSRAIQSLRKELARLGIQP